MHTDTTPNSSTPTMTENKNQTGPRIYVACLAAYNAGKLHGAWIDVQGKDADEIAQEVIARVLLTSPEPNVTRCATCHAIKGYDGVWDREKCSLVSEGGKLTDAPHDPAPSSEEWAIHDYEGFGGLDVSEHASFEHVAALAELLEDHPGKVIQTAIDHLGDATTDARRVQDWIADNYAGEWETLEAFAENMLEDTGEMDTWPKVARDYFDMERYARDLELGGDVFTIEAPGGVFVFWNR